MIRKIPLHVKILLGMALGLAWGILVVGSGNEALLRFSFHWVHPLGEIFINLLQLIAIPMIITSLITGIASLNDIGKLGRIGGRTMLTFLITTVFAITIGLVCVNVIKPGAMMPEETREMLLAGNRTAVEDRAKLAEELQDLPHLQPIVNLFPKNIVLSATDNGNMLQIVIFALIMGIAAVLVPREKSEPVVRLMDGANEMVMKVVDLIMLLAPFGVLALLSKLVVDMAKDDPGQVIGILKSLAAYGGTLLLALSLHLVLVYLMMVKFLAKKKPLWFLRKIYPVQLLGFSTSSSNATLPVNMETCEKELGISEEVTGFVLPLGATVNMDGTSCYQAIATVFIAQVFTLDLDFTQQLTIILTALLSSVGSAGVPGAGLVMLIIVLRSVNVPTEGIALILGVDRILDMCRTAVNVTGDAAVCMTIGRMEGKLKEIPESE